MALPSNVDRGANGLVRCVAKIPFMNYMIGDFAAFEDRTAEILFDKGAVRYAKPGEKAPTSALAESDETRVKIRVTSGFNNYVAGDVCVVSESIYEKARLKGWATKIEEPTKALDAPPMNKAVQPQQTARK